MAETFKPTAEDFGEALRAQRMERGLNYAEVADRIGCKKARVKNLERGRALPVGAEVPRLRATFPRLKPYLDALPRLNSAADDEVPEEAAAVAEPELEADVDAGDELAPPATFGEALRRERVAEGLYQREVAELVGVTGGSVWWWEKDLAVPIREHYDRLRELFPGLRRAPDPGSRDLAKPVGLAGYQEADVIPIRKPDPEPEPDLEPEPDCDGWSEAEAAALEENAQAMRADAVARAGAAHATALVAASRARARVAALEAELAEARAQADDAQRAVEDAVAALETAVAAAAEGEG